MLALALGPMHALLRWFRKRHGAAATTQVKQASAGAASTIRPLCPASSGSQPSTQIPPKNLPPVFTGRDVEEFATHAVTYLLDDISKTIIRWLPGRLSKLNPEPRNGSFNCAFFATLDTGTQVVIRLSNPATCDGRRFAADAHLMKMFREKTTIPVPEILGMDADPHNPLGCRYLILTQAKGVCLDELWHNDKRMTPTKRNLVLQQLALLMLQLSHFEFDLLGDLIVEPETNTLRVVPMLSLEAPEESPNSPNRLPEHLSAPFGPYDRVSDMHDVLLQRMQAAYPADPWSYIFSLLAPALSSSVSNRAPFVLRHPDLDLQNVFVDPQTSQITAIIDWDHVSRTVPRSRGFAGFPLWIIRDWDPFVYGYGPLLEESVTNSQASSEAGEGASQPEVSSDGVGAQASKEEGQEEEEDNNEPAEVLQGYRAVYVNTVASHSPQLVAITAQSHISLVLDSALRSAIPRGGIGFRLVNHVFGKTWFNPFDAPLALKDGAWYGDANTGPALSDTYY